MTTATRYDVLSRDGRQSQGMMSNVHLSALELHDFSDLRSADGRSNHMLRWAVAIAAILVVSHFVFNPSDVASLTQASIGATPTMTLL